MSLIFSTLVNIVLNTLSSGQCVISAASGEEVCPRPTTELTCPREERIRVLMKKSEYFSSVLNCNFYAWAQSVCGIDMQQKSYSTFLSDPSPIIGYACQ